MNANIKTFTRQLTWIMNESVDRTWQELSEKDQLLLTNNLGE